MNKKEYALQEVLIKAEDVSLRYGDKQILRDINFEVLNVVRPGVEQGQVVALIGRSGMGKTQLFRIIAGLNQPTTGRILITSDQHPVHPGEVGIVPQNYILFQHRTIYQNLKLGLVNCGRKLVSKECDDTIRKYAEDFELTEHLQKYPSQLSGGQRQRVSIIQQVLTDNKFLLFDEPFSGLDSRAIDKVLGLLNKVSTLNELNTLIIVSHDIPNSLAIADTVWVLSREADKPGATLTQRYDLKEMGLAWDPQIKERTEFQELVTAVVKQL
jgi:ABC-type nitrate/sulfonate/bicarbonate transport system ATPase subunit